MAISRIRVYSNEEPVGDIILNGGKAVTDPANPKLTKFLDEAFVADPKTGEKLTRDDGERYLAALPYNFSGSYFHMGEVLTTT